MAKLNRLLVFVALVLALAAMAFSILLATPRDAFSKRASADVAALVDATKALSAGSGSDLSKNVTFTPADAEIGTKEEGSMSWLEYKTSADAYQKRLTDVVALATDVAKQRDMLAGQLAAVSASLGGDAQAEQLCALGTASETATKVAALAAATKERDDKMVASIVNSGTVLGIDISRDSLTRYDGTTFTDSATALTDFESKVTNTTERAAEYAKTLDDAVATISEQPWAKDDLYKLRDPEGYRVATTAFSNGAADININLKASAELKTKLEERIEELQAVKEELAKRTISDQELQAELSSKVAELEELRKIVTQDGVQIDPRRLAAKATELDPDLTGKVLYVDKDYKYVILDLGKSQVPENARLLVHRGEDLLGTVSVSRVTATACVAEIMPNSKRIEDGDTVIPPMAGGN